MVNLKRSHPPRLIMTYGTHTMPENPKRADDDLLICKLAGPECRKGGCAQTTSDIQYDNEGVLLCFNVQSLSWVLCKLWGMNGRVKGRGGQGVHGLSMKGTLFDVRMPHQDLHLGKPQRIAPSVRQTDGT